LGIPLARTFARDPLGTSERLVREYGPVVALRFGPVQAYLAADPVAVHQVLTTNSRAFRKEPRVRRAVAQIDGKGLITTEGDFWLRQRRLVQKAFAANRFPHYADVVVAAAERAAARWPAAGELEICSEMTHLSLEIIARALFEVDLASEAPLLAENAEYVSESIVRELGAIVPVPDWIPTRHKRQKRRALRAVDEMIWRLIRQRRAEGVDRGDLLSMLLLAVDTEGDGSSMSDKQVRDEATTLFVAGYDTSASGLAWTWYLLAQHPELAERAAAEARGVLGERVATFDDFERLSFVRQCVQEALRMYPPAWLLMVREAIVDTELAGYPIRRKSWVYLMPWVTHRSEHWFPEPLVFDPDRFSPERVGQIPPHAYFPFGGGPHVCIGERFAMMEMTLTVATLLRRYRFALAPGQAPVEPEPHTAIRPRGGLRLSVERR
jgi:cytochrome P450